MLRLLLREVRGLIMKTTKWLATRVLHDPSGKKIEVQLGFPEPWGTDWRCAYRITGLKPRARYGAGVDAMQALSSAFESIATDLRESGQTLSWLGMQGETGIRRQVPIAMGPQFANKIEALIDKQIVSFIEKKKKKAGLL